MAKKLTTKEKRKRAYEKSSLPYSFNAKIRHAFYGRKCPICGVKMRRELYWDNNRPTIQHNKPITLGGKHNINNISVICLTCNSKINNKQITSSLNNDVVKLVWNQIKNRRDWFTMVINYE